ncbi:SDR family NAD(P)-dependent oxidoreductase [Flavobacteriales bacterium]|nr:SDR family NAD(P)-dependent oxidoreductase [Flavobacteriales bacterium]
MQKVALITGTGSGIGKALAKLLLSKNYLVFGYSRTNQIENKNFTFTKIDLSSLEEICKLQFPNINIATNILLVNNAATIGSILPLDKKTTTDIVNEYHLNLITPTLLSRKFISTYALQQKLLINISSGAANSPIASWSTYCVAKSGLDMLTKVINEEKQDNLQLFSIHPGVVDTKMQHEIRNSDRRYFPLLDKFIAYYNDNKLENIQGTAKKIYYIVQNTNKFPDNIVSLRDVKIK